MTIDNSFTEQGTNPEEEGLGEFLNNIFDKDQSTVHHENAQECLDSLRAKKDSFTGTSFEKYYWDAVSFELFHLGQSSALQWDNITAILNIEESLSAAEKGFNNEWYFYVKGTLAYLKGDLPSLSENITKSGENSNVLSRLKLGLQKRGRPDYKKDY